MSSSSPLKASRLQPSRNNHRRKFEVFKGWNSYKFLKKYEATGSISRRVGSGRPSKITAEIKQIVE